MFLLCKLNLGLRFSGENRCCCRSVMTSLIAVVMHTSGVTTTSGMRCVKVEKLSVEEEKLRLLL